MIRTLGRTNAGKPVEAGSQYPGLSERLGGGAAHVRARLAALALVITLPALAAGTVAAMTGEEWQGLPPTARAAYVTAIVDAWSSFAIVKESLGSTDAGITVFTEMVACVRDRGLTPAHVLALVEKYTDGQPGLRGKDMPDVVFAALSEACRR